jgi:hypothetical protein
MTIVSPGNCSTKCRAMGWAESPPKKVSALMESCATWKSLPVLAIAVPQCPCKTASISGRRYLWSVNKGTSSLHSACAMVSSCPIVSSLSGAQGLGNGAP